LQLTQKGSSEQPATERATTTIAVSVTAWRAPTDTRVRRRIKKSPIKPRPNQPPAPLLDVVAPVGTPILAPGAGVVLSAKRETGYGNTVVIDHGHGIVTRYAHASRLLVRAGQRLERGDRIALVGNSGLSTSPHLHYEVHVNGKPVNPMRYVLPSVVTD
jgi:murein DD-endopeptidase MepM/ murein hydrolase activator NlpD